jgi:hypothetical protein
MRLAETSERSSPPSSSMPGAGIPDQSSVDGRSAEGFETGREIALGRECHWRQLCNSDTDWTPDTSPCCAQPLRLRSVGFTIGLR